MAHSWACHLGPSVAGSHRPRALPLRQASGCRIAPCLTHADLTPLASYPTWVTCATAARWISPMEQAELDADSSDSQGASGASSAIEEPQLPLQLRVRIGLAESSGRLDLTDCRLAHLPAEVLELKGLEDLSLAGNRLSSLPEGISALTSLKRLGLAGNRLTHLPDNIGCLTELEGLWLHGNLISSVPESISTLVNLKQLSLSGNQLTQLPDVWSGMTLLEDLAVAGNRLKQLPLTFGNLSSLRKLSANGNCLESLPDNLSGLTSLQELWLQGNRLTHLPESLCYLKDLQELSLGDNSLVSLPSHFSHLSSLEKLWLYGNHLTALPAGFLSGLTQLTQGWLEGNPQLQGEQVTLMLQDLASAVQSTTPQPSTQNASGAASSPLHAGECSTTAGQGSSDARWTLLHPHTLGMDAAMSAIPGSAQASGWRLKALGLDTHQLQGVHQEVLDAARSRIKVGEVIGTGHGYFKLSRSTAKPVTEKIQSVLVVAFGSAPGTPNWGGLLGRLYRAASSEAEKAFDVLYVVDPSRRWYGACTPQDGNTSDGAAAGPSAQYYYKRLEQYTEQYDRVIMLGDSMGATAALMFAPLATHVMAFCPQVDLTTSCMRPGVPDQALSSVKQVVLDALKKLPEGNGSSGGGSRPTTQVVALSGTWQHDLDQVNVLPANKVRHQVYTLESHRLALHLEKQGKLLPLVQETILSALGLQGKKLVRTANLL